jgi:primosomal protein N'
LSGKNPADVEGLARRLAQELDKRLSPGTSILGPAPAFPAVVARRHRWHIVIKGRTGAILRDIARKAMRKMAGEPGASRVRVSADVDPLNVMS